MEQRGLLQSVLIQVLFLKVCFSEETNLHCPNVTGTVGEPLTLTCTLRCGNCNVAGYKWKKNETSLQHANSIGELIFSYKTKKPADNGSYGFWLQLSDTSAVKYFTASASEPEPTASNSTRPDTHENHDLHNTNITGTTVGLLHYTVKCENCSTLLYRWTNNATPLEHLAGTGELTFNYTIKEASMTDNGTYAFWVQLTEDSTTQNFTVNISEVAPHLPSSPTPGEYKTDRPETAVTGIVVVICIAIGLLAFIALHKQCKSNYKALKLPCIKNLSIEESG
ncbi:uncharacterized protein [Hoplias malabaricus]|uniref:uncharacterized protein n=1 Tax=Hoplias malabaricus TaxID=27720 RepID=UPI00346199D0